MPESLVKELEKLVEKDHYIDLSEEIRSIVREKWTEQTQPELSELKKLREDIEQNVAEISTKRIRQEVTQELKKIQQQVKEGLGHER